MTAALCAILALGMLCVTAAFAHAAAKPVTETIWWGALRGDSLFVRATWIPTVREAWCLSFTGRDWGAESTAVRPKYVGYRIQDGRARVRSRGVLSDPMSQQFCCDGLAVTSTPWRRGLVLELTASGWGCEPAGDCAQSRFIYVGGRDSVASSEWTDIAWDPAADGLIDTWMSDGCLAYPMTVQPRVRGSSLVFEPTFPPGVREGDLLEQPTSQDEEWMDCVRPFSPAAPTSIDLYPTPNSMDAQRLVVGATDRIEIFATVIRAERTSTARLSPQLYRVGIRVAGRVGYVTRADLVAAGFAGLQAAP